MRRMTRLGFGEEKTVIEDRYDRAQALAPLGVPFLGVKVLLLQLVEVEVIRAVE